MLGVSDDMLRRLMRAGVVERMQPGAFRFAATPPTWHASLKGVCIWGGAGTWASHRSAGALWGLEGVPPHLEISTVRRIRCGDKGIILHCLEAMPPGDVRSLRIFPVTSVARTLVDLSGVVDAEVLEALDHALRERMTTLAALGARLCALGGKGRTGTGRLRRLLEDRAVGTRPVESRQRSSSFACWRGLVCPGPTPVHGTGRSRVRGSAGFRVPAVAGRDRVPQLPRSLEHAGLEVGPGAQLRTRAPRVAHPLCHLGRGREQQGRGGEPRLGTSGTHFRL